MALKQFLQHPRALKNNEMHIRNLFNREPVSPCLEKKDLFEHAVTCNVSSSNEQTESPLQKVKINHVPSRGKNWKIIKMKSRTIEDGNRRNEVNIEMLSARLYQQIFGKDEGPLITEEQISRARNHLNEHQLLDNVADFLPTVSLTLPSLAGSNIEEHFYSIAEAQCSPYRKIINSLLVELPQMPRSWSKKQGWTKYIPGKEPCSVAFPDEDALVVDVEECLSARLGPTLATAVSATAWYSWLSSPLAAMLENGNTSGTEKKRFTPDDLINMESNATDCKHKAITKPKIIVGHNVSYDRARIKEQYWLEPSATRFLDTMALHIAVSGVTSFQKIQLSSKKSNSNEVPNYEFDFDDFWANKSSLNNLSDVHKLYCGGEGIEKSARDVFTVGTLKDVADQFKELVTYCAKDVLATHQVLKILFPMFEQRFPHPASMAGMLELSIAYLPVNQSWLSYIRDANEIHNDLEAEAKLILAKKAKDACRLMHNDKYKEDPWMWDQDWTTQDLKMKKNVKKNNLDWDEEDRVDPMAGKFKYLAQQEAYLPANRPHLPGYPAWYRKLCSRLKENNQEEWAPGPGLVTSGMSLAPKLLRLTWDGYPLHKDQKHGWGLIIPGRPLSDFDEPSNVPIVSIEKMCPHAPVDTSDAKIEDLAQQTEEIISKKDYYDSKRRRSNTETEPKWYQGSGVWCPDVNIPGCWFRKLPHPAGSNRNVGNPLSKDFVTRLSEGTLRGEGNAAALLEIKNTVSYWRNNRERVESQNVVWLDNKCLPRKLQQLLHNDDSVQLGAIVPQLLVCGTLTRRAVEKTWLTASNALSDRLGSELRAMVQAPPGYHMVGADVDSQELWLAALLGDASFAGLHGATAFGWRTLQGKKSDGTDLHSVTAKAAGTTRDHAKVMNYARIYGAGNQFAQHLLKRFNPAMTEEETRSAASKTMNLTKGQRVYYLPKASINSLIKLEMCERAPENSKKAFLYPWGRFGHLAEDGGVVLTDRELKSLRQYESTCGLNLSDSPTGNVTKTWHGGTESAMFNKLEEVANRAHPCTPFLGAQLSRALEPIAVGTDNYMTTRVNWVVQSSAVDFLHLMLVSMRWLLGNSTDWRFVLSFHDEVRYMVPSEKRYEAALALQVTNLLARAFCARRVGIHDLPRSVAFFSAVEVDKAMRKDANSECTTPSNPYGLFRGHGVPKGETLDILQVLEKTGPDALVKKMKKRNKSVSNQH